MKPRIFKAFGWLMLFGACYLVGATVAEMKTMDAETAASKSVITESQDWGLGFSEKGNPPTGMANAEELSKYQAYYLGDTAQKKLYLTFDAGFENGYTPDVLDTLKKQATYSIIPCRIANSKMSTFSKKIKTCPCKKQ